MSKPLSVDLRERVVAAVDGGLSRRKAADRFGVSISSAIRWTAQVRRTGDVQPQRVGGDKRSGRIEAHAWRDPGRGRGEAGHHLGGAAGASDEPGRGGGRLHAVALLRPKKDHAEKKSGHASEQDRPDVLSRRQAWFEGQLDLDPARLIFIDETGASTKMARLHGRAPRGQRLRAALPHGHWKTTTFVGALRLSGYDRAYGAGRPHDRSLIPRLRRAGARSDACPRGCCSPGQPAGPQRLGGARGCRGGRRSAPLPPAL